MEKASGTVTQFDSAGEPLNSLVSGLRARHEPGVVPRYELMVLVM